MTADRRNLWHLRDLDPGTVYRVDDSGTTYTLGAKTNRDGIVEVVRWPAQPTVLVDRDDLWRVLDMASSDASPTSQQLDAWGRLRKAAQS